MAKMNPLAKEAQAAAAELLAEQKWPQVIKLEHPITFGDEKIASLTFNRGKLLHLKGISMEELPPTDDLLLIASRMCGQPVGVLEQIEDGDIQKVLRIPISFFARCLAAGRK